MRPKLCETSSTVWLLKVELVHRILTRSCPHLGQGTQINIFKNFVWVEDIWAVFFVTLLQPEGTISGLILTLAVPTEESLGKLLNSCCFAHSKSPTMIISKNVFYVEELFTETLNPDFVHQMDSTGSTSKHKAPPASLQPVLYWCPSSAHCYFQITVDGWTPVFSLSPSGCWLCIRADLMQLTETVLCRSVMTHTFIKRF